MSGEKKSFRFALNGEEVVRELHSLTDRIEKKEVIVQSVTRQARRTLDDFETFTFLMKYARKR